MNYGYGKAYFLVVDGNVLYYDQDYDKVLEKIADLYGDRLCIDYYGFIGREDILKCEYMDMHEGSTFFISNTWLEDFENSGEGKKNIYIEIIESGYIMEYADTEGGLAIIEWLRANPDKYCLDYSDSGLKKYCVMVEDTLEYSSESLKDAFNYLKNHEMYGDFKVKFVPEGVKLKELGLGALRNRNGYYDIPWNIAGGEAECDMRIAIIDLGTVFNHFHTLCGSSLAYELDRDRSRYSIYIKDDDYCLKKACEMLVRMKGCADCWEFQESEESCPFKNKCNENNNTCYSVEEWIRYFKSLTIMS